MEMKAEQVGAAATLVGLLLVVAAAVWPSIDDPRSEWSDEDAQVYQETIARVHEGAYLEARAQDRPSVHGRKMPDPDRLMQHREDVKTMDQLTERLNTAKARPYRIAGILQWSGAGLVAVGVGVLLAGRSRNA